MQKQFRKQAVFTVVITIVALLSLCGLQSVNYQEDQKNPEAVETVITPEPTQSPVVTPAPTIEPTPEPTPKPEVSNYIGTYNMSHYCIQVRHDIPNHGTAWCGNSNKGARGHTLIPNTSIAVPKSLLNSTLPAGTKVKLVFSDGSSQTAIVHDTGGALGKKQRIDMCVATHEEAMNRGVVKNVKVYKIG